jgi:glutaredoxin 3
MKITIWSKNNCPQCDKAKSFLNGMGLSYQENKIGVGQYDVSDLLALVPTAKSVPQIFIDGTHIGGYNELVAKLGENN